MMMGVPGVGHLTVLAFISTIEDLKRFGDRGTSASGVDGVDDPAAGHRLPIMFVDPRRHPKWSAGHIAVAASPLAVAGWRVCFPASTSRERRVRRSTWSSCIKPCSRSL